MAFFQTIGQSVYGPRFYEDVPRKRLGSALGYFLLLVLLITIARVAILTGPTIVGVGESLRSGVADLVALYPSDLRISVANGRATANVREPYIIPATKGTADELEVENLLVIDTRTPFSGAQFHRYRTLMWLTRDTLFVAQNNGSYRAFDLSQFDSLIVDREGVDELAKVIEPYFGLVGPIIAVGAFVVFFVGGALRLVYMLGLALLVWVVAKAMSRQIGHGAAYKIGVYAMTLPAFVELLLAIGGGWLRFSGFPFMFGLLTLLVVALNLARARQTEPVPDEAGVLVGTP